MRVTLKFKLAAAFTVVVVLAAAGMGAGYLNLTQPQRSLAHRDRQLLGKGRNHQRDRCRS